MIRRRRPPREIPFSFDSFLDVVANVVGIIIRLILVTWVGARSYSSFSHVTRPAGAGSSPANLPGATALPEDPLQQELARHRHELAEAQARLLEQLRQLKLVQQQDAEVKQRLAGVADQQQSLEQERAALEAKVREKGQVVQVASVSLADLQRRQQQLMEDLRALEKLPPPAHVLRYHTAVSQPVQSDEFMFECRDGRVTFIDLASLQEDIRSRTDAIAKELRSRYELTDVTEPVGAFRLRYTFERERGALDSVLGGASPDNSGGFRYGLKEWIVEPVTMARGESPAEALAAGSQFRQIADRLDPQLAVVTFWVTPNSFAVFRRLRDYLYERDLVVAGRPLPEGFPIMSSRDGTLSRGQ